MSATPVWRNKQNLALLAMAGAVATWGCSNVAIKVVSTTGLVASFYRLWFAIPLLWAVAAASPSVRHRLNRTWLRGSLVGGALFGLHQILFFNSLKLTSVANVSIIGALQPALVLLLAGRMFGERATLRAVLWSAVALGGTVIVVVGSAGAPSWSLLGDVLAMANLFAFTAYFLASKNIRSRTGAFEYVVGMTTVAGVVILCVSLATGQELLAPSGRDWGILLFLAVFPGTLGHVLTNWAHGYASAFVMSIIMLAVPVLASGGAAVILGEALRPAQIAGGGIVLTAIGAIVLSTAGDTPAQLAESAAVTDAP